MNADGCDTHHVAQGRSARRQLDDALARGGRREYMHTELPDTDTARAHVAGRKLEDVRPSRPEPDRREHDGRVDVTSEGSLF